MFYITKGRKRTIVNYILYLIFKKPTFFSKPQFNNYGNTEVGLQVGATGAVFNNHAGGNYIKETMK